jgi:general secretion pathway protein I
MAWAMMKHQKCRGFTLIEVLVAIAILTIALTSIYRLQSDTFRMSADARFYAMAPLLAQQQLSTLERQGLSNATDGSGDFGQEYPGYQWAVRIEDATADLIKNPQQHLIRIDVVVTGDAHMSYELRTYRFYVNE